MRACVRACEFRFVSCTEEKGTLNPDQGTRKLNSGQAVDRHHTNTATKSWITDSKFPPGMRVNTMLTKTPLNMQLSDFKV